MPMDQTRRGLLAALSAYGLWGIAPIYFKWMASVSAAEIIAHRIIWSLILLVAVLFILGKLSQVKTLLPKFPWLMLTAVLISTNWLIFVWAVTHERISETSLGYYINPLVSVLLARLFLGERLRLLQGIAFAFAAAGVLVRLVEYGHLPWVALVLAISFGFYGLVRKQIEVPAIAGLLLETSVLAPVAIIYLFWLNQQGVLSFAHVDWQTNLLLVSAGFVTTIPLLCFAAGVVRLPLTTIGILQYIAPSMSLIIAIFLYGEPFSSADLLSFVLIWIGLLVFTLDSFRRSRLYRQPAIPAPALKQ